MVGRTRLNVKLYIYDLSSLSLSLRHQPIVRTVVKSSKTDNEKSTEHSYRVGYRMPLAGEANAIVEILMKI